MHASTETGNDVDRPSASALHGSILATRGALAQRHEARESFRMS
jgi:hypothetical protein